MHTTKPLAALLALAALAASPSSSRADGDRPHDGGAVQLGPRPFYLVEGMDEGPLKDRLLRCEHGPFRRTDFSIGHRGAALQFPEHSDVAYRAGARMGAGIVECDVTFTRDGELVCRHSECDLHTTTDIVATPLNAKCTVPWTGPVGPNPAPQCCTSDLTLAEFKTLNAKMDASNPAATTARGYLGGTAAFRTDLYVGRAKVVSFRESIELNRRLGVKHTPELKGATHQDRVDAIFGGQEQYAQALIDELRRAGVHPGDVFAQSFNLDDVRYWLRAAPRFGRQAVYLDSIDPTVTPAIPRLGADELRRIRQEGVRIIAPPIFALLAVNDAGEIVPSEYARDIQRAGLDIIAWTFERSDLRQGAAPAGFYWLFDPQGRAVRKDADMYKALDVLARDVKILGIFSDWPATVSYYASCMGLK
jgi:glycerophosphoryl diester phosphodiesterase